MYNCYVQLKYIVLITYLKKLYYIYIEDYYFKSMYTEWFKALVQYLRRLLGRSFVAENANNFFFQILHCFRVTTFNVDVAMYYCDRLTGAPRWELVEEQIVEAQLSDLDSSTGNKSDKSH
jgi:hypothetical protein